MKKQKENKSSLIPVIIDVLGALFGIFLMLKIHFIFLFVVPLIAYFITWYKYREVFWKSYWGSLFVIFLLIVLLTALIIYTDLSRYIFELNILEFLNLN